MVGSQLGTDLTMIVYNDEDDDGDDYYDADDDDDDGDGDGRQSKTLRDWRWDTPIFMGKCGFRKILV